MRHTTALRVADVRAAVRVAGECSELWNAPDAWQPHLLRRAGELLHLPVAMLCEVDTLAPGEAVTFEAGAEFGWPDTKTRDRFGRGTRELGGALFATSPVDLAFRQALYRRQDQQSASRSRACLIPDATWHESAAYREVYRPAGMDEVVFSAVRLPTRSSVSVLAVGGPDHRPTRREARLLGLLHGEVARLIGTRLTTHRELGPHRLTPRQREVFDLLLTGLDEPAIARRLYRSRSTVNEHIARIYAAFGVSSRAAFMARQLRRTPQTLPPQPRRRRR